MRDREMAKVAETAMFGYYKKGSRLGCGLDMKAGDRAARPAQQSVCYLTSLITGI
jgi:hypothetical protein